MHSASIIIDFTHARCGSCKCTLADDLATRCSVCEALFDCATSNHVGLAAKFLKRRVEAGLAFAVPAPPASTESKPSGETPSNGAAGADCPEEETVHAAITVDFSNMRCSGCKVVVGDELAKECPTCHAVFDQVASNHVGLAAKLEKVRAAASL